MLRNSFYVVILYLLTAFTLTYCGGGASVPQVPKDLVKEDPSFSQDIQVILTINCTISDCHNSTAQAGLNLSKGQAYQNMVNVDSTQDPSRKRVLPYSAEISYVVIKIEDRQSVGTRMPKWAPPLEEDDTQNIKNWINKGAKNN